MAGYGTSIFTPTWCDPLVRQLMKAAQRRAKPLDLDMHYRRRPNGELSDWEMWVDGNGYRIAAWSRRLERDLPIVAEGFQGPPTGLKARWIAESLVSRWIDFAVGTDDAPVSIRTSVRDPVKWIWPIIRYVEEHDLTPRMVLADEMLARWMTGEAEHEIVIEEIHTLAEGLLRLVTGSGRTVRWPVLLGRALDRDLLTPTSHAELGRLNGEFRNRLKHRTRTLTDVERSKVEDLLWATISALDQLMEQVREA